LFCSVGLGTEINMRFLRPFAAILVSAAWIGSAAAALPRLPSRAATLSMTSVVRADARCGHGRHWIPPGYAKHGKWRNGHCSPN
jgi:hypothetical protein